MARLKPCPSFSDAHSLGIASEASAPTIANEDGEAKALGGIRYLWYGC
jgi:hypothetical protein